MKAVLAILILGLLTLGGLGGYLYLQNGKSLGLGILTLKPLASPTPVGEAVNLPVYVSPTPTGAIAVPPSTASAVVVFETEGSFTPIEKSELTKKVVNPLVDYYADLQPGSLVSLTISHNTQASSADYPYQGQAIFKGGGNTGFLISKLGSGVDWWFPECMGPCPYTDTYKAKYPEVVAKTENN